MLYFDKDNEIIASINQLTTYQILWLDTEVADYFTQFPRLSLIQVLAEPNDLNGDSAYILDVLNQPELVAIFISQIMENINIKKVFHNSDFALKYLGGKQAQNIICTYKIARRISPSRLCTSNLKLKTLAKELCGFTDVDTEEGKSDWGKRPLSTKQLEYAKMDTVYLAQVYLYLSTWTP